MNKRIWLLLVLFSATLLIRGMHVYHLFSSPSSTVEWAAGASYTIEGNQLTVRSVRPKNPSGQPTLAAQVSLQKGDRILAIYNVRGAGKTIRSLFDYGEVARTIQFGEPWTLVIAREVGGGQWQERQLLEQLHTRLIVPLATTERLLGFISLGEKLSEEPYSKEDKELLLAVAQQTAIALDYAQLISHVAEQEKLKLEIEFAKEVQAELFPQTLPQLKTLDYTGSCQPASGVGGDYYDFLLLAADQLGIALGDISGKGVSAALLMASLQALLRSHAPACGNRVDKLISEINRLMHASTGSSKYATFFYGLYDDRQRTLTYVNAGHNAPMLFRPTEIAASQLGAHGACSMKSAKWCAAMFVVAF